MVKCCQCCKSPKLDLSKVPYSFLITKYYKLNFILSCSILFWSSRIDYSLLDILPECLMVGLITRSRVLCPPLVIR